MIPRCYKLCNRNLTPLILAESGKSCVGRGVSSAPVYQPFIAEADGSLRKKQKRIPIVTCRDAALNCYVEDETPEPKQLKLASSKWERKAVKRDYFCIHPFPVESVESDELSRRGSFMNFQLNPNILSLLEESGIKRPTPIQAIGIPEILGGQNTLLAAETGCGKTLAYLLPLLEQVSRWKKVINKERGYNSPFAIVAAPTKELSQQIGAETTRLASAIGLSTKVLAFRNLKQMVMRAPVDDVDILVGSIGSIRRLVSLGIYKTNLVRHVVLDEADAVFHWSFSGELNNFLRRIKLSHSIEETMVKRDFPRMTQLTLASATMPSKLAAALGAFINVDDLRILTTSNLHRVHVLQRFIRLGNAQKPAELLKSLKKTGARTKQTIVFSNSTKTCNWLSMFLEEFCIDVVRINGSMPLAERRRIYETFRNGDARVLSATDAGSRGLDTTWVNRIVNYDFPMSTADYIHSIYLGAVERAGWADQRTVM